MTPEFIDRLVEAVLYEGHILYPYRATSQKNRQRFTFGRVYPEAYSAAQGGAEPCAMQTECLVRPLASGAKVAVEVRFLQAMSREVGLLPEPVSIWVSREPEPDLRLVPSLEMEGRLYQSWQECAERRVVAEIILEKAGEPRTVPFSFEADRSVEPIVNGNGLIPAVIVRRNERISGHISVSVTAVAGGWFRLCVRIANQTPVPSAPLASDEAVVLHSLASAHTLLRASGATFCSVTAPPADLAQEAAACRNVGTWPVLVGDTEQELSDTMLSSPIVLPDFPKLAPESPGTLFDGTEIDEILTLRIITMTDAEKREMRSIDEHARRLLERTESLPPEHLLAMHGVMRKPASFDEAIFGGSNRISSAKLGETELRAGDRVIIRPKARADVMDMALAGKTATIEAIEEDAEGRIHLALVAEDDPGRDMGLMRQTGHRFFYGLDEVEACLEGAQQQ
ncbi:MAG TPA: hypothetical protein VFE25_12540 [Opitutaceae bacterium]|nr:hypothetical protein [Opitutaceae bacterium]